jgi:hypothetical protein
MQLRRRQLPLFLSVLAALFLFGLGAVADEGWRETGSGTRVKTVVFVDVNVYRISHFVKGEVADKSKAGVIKADVDKKFVWKMMRDVDKEKVQQTARDAFALNGYTNKANIDKYVGAFSDLKENAKITITYDSSKKSTTISVGGGGTATIEGVDFMHAVWSVWFGKIDQPKLGDQLIAKL